MSRKLPRLFAALLGVAILLVTAAKWAVARTLVDRRGQGGPAPAAPAFSSASQTFPKPEAKAREPGPPLPLVQPATVDDNLSPAKGAAPAASPPPSLAADPEAGGARKELKTAIIEAARLLESGDMLAFVKTFVSPKLLQNLPAGLTLEQLIQRSMADPNYQQNQQSTVDALRACEDLEPALNAAGDRAVYTLEPPVGEHARIYFVLIDGEWYMDRM